MRASDPDKRILYPTLPHQLAVDETLREGLSEELRVLYVALTRAREHLVLVGRMAPQRVALHRAMQQSRKASAKAPGASTALPRLQLESATSALDWLLAAISAVPESMVHWKEGRNTRAGALFEVTTFSRAGTDQWRIPPAVEPERAEALARIARLEPLPKNEPLAAPDDADRLVTALGRDYPARALTTIPGRLPVGELKRRWDTTIDGDDRVPPTRRAIEPPRPAFVMKEAVRDPTIRGSATHRFLQLVDLTRPCNVNDLKRQLAGLRELGRISPADASAVLIESAAWFFGTELGGRIRAGAADVHREVAFDARIGPEHYDPRIVSRDPRDAILVRGVVDLVLDAAEGLEIVDYKTDVFPPAACQQRIDAYRPQIEIYATAIEAIHRQPVTGRWLVFLQGRTIAGL